MRQLFYNFLEMTISSGVLYAYYHFFLRNSRFHQYNRFYLLGIVAISLLVPFLHIPIYFSSGSEQTPMLETLQALSFNANATDRPTVNASGIEWTTVLFILYGLVGCFLLVRLLLSLVKLRSIVRRNPVEDLEGIYFVRTNEPGTPFSFFRWMFWDNRIELDSPRGDRVFRHEVFHIQQRHSRDVVFLELVGMLCWINPFFYLIKKELKAIHEFLADKFAAGDTEKWEYAELLLMQALKTKHNLVNPFFHNQIKRRIAMITKPQTTEQQYLRKILVLPIVALLIFVFAFTYKSKAQQVTVEPLKTNLRLAEVRPDTVPHAGVYTVTADKVVVKNSALKDGKSLVIINGKETNQDGLKEISIEGGSMMIYEKGSPEALTYGEKGKDGVMIFKNAKITKIEKNVAGESFITLDDKEPLYVVNDKIQKIQGADALKEIKPESIKTINVLKGDAAMTKYGNKGKNGVIEIKLKPAIEKAEVELQEITEVQVKPVNVEVEEVQITGEARKVTPLKPEGTVSEVEMNATSKQRLNLQTTAPRELSVYPNPVGDHATLQITSTEEGRGTVTITDMNGTPLRVNAVNLVKGPNTLSIPTASLAKGVYILSVTDAKKKTLSSYKLVKE
jgi:beta-lactamase regulating signal transducer with metallopeptidase domain